MIPLHRLSRERELFLLNPDLILTVEAHPDTVVTLTTGAKLIVVESPIEVAASVHDFRASVLADALSGPQAQTSPGSGR